MKIALASKTQADWQQLSSVFSHSQLDTGDPSTRGYAKFLQQLIGDQKHIFYSFFVEMDVDTLLDIVTNTRLTLSMIEDEESGFISGSLCDWIEAIKKFCVPDKHRISRAFFTAILIYLETDGVRLSTTELKDKTYYVN